MKGDQTQMIANQMKAIQKLNSIQNKILLTIKWKPGFLIGKKMKLQKIKIEKKLKSLQIC